MAFAKIRRDRRSPGIGSAFGWQWALVFPLILAALVFVLTYRSGPVFESIAIVKADLPTAVRIKSPDILDAVSRGNLVDGRGPKDTRSWQELDRASYFVPLAHDRIAFHFLADSPEAARQFGETVFSEFSRLASPSPSSRPGLREKHASLRMLLAMLQRVVAGQQAIIDKATENGLTDLAAEARANRTAAAAGAARIESDLHAVEALMPRLAADFVLSPPSLPTAPRNGLLDRLVDSAAAALACGLLLYMVLRVFHLRARSSVRRPVSGPQEP